MINSLSNLKKFNEILKQNNSSNVPNIFTKEWKKIKTSNEKPSNYINTIQIDYFDFINKVIEQDIIFVKNFVESVYLGNVYLLKNAITKKEIDFIKRKFNSFAKKNESTFHKIYEGVPNFHRLIDEVNPKYTLEHIKHSYYLFPWNKENSGLRELLINLHRPLKFAAGLSPMEFEKNTPKDEVVERIQVVRYIKNGFIEPHLDPVGYLNLVFSVYLSKKGDPNDYIKGGFNVFNKNEKKIDLEEFIDQGDMGLFFPSLKHSVEAVDVKEEKNNSSSENGRWWIGYNIIHSDHVKGEERNTTRPLK